MIAASAREVARSFALAVGASCIVVAGVVAAPHIVVRTSGQLAGFALAYCGGAALALWLFALAVCPDLWKHGRRRGRDVPEVAATDRALVSSGFVVDRIPAEQLTEPVR